MMVPYSARRFRRALLLREPNGLMLAINPDFDISRVVNFFPTEVRTGVEEIDEVDEDGDGNGLERLKAAFPGCVEFCVRFSKSNYQEILDSCRFSLLARSID